MKGWTVEKAPSEAKSLTSLTEVYKPWDETSLRSKINGFADDYVIGDQVEGFGEVNEDEIHRSLASIQVAIDEVQEVDEVGGDRGGLHIAKMLKIYGTYICLCESN